MAINTLNFGSKVVFLNGLPLTLPVAASDPGTASAGDMYYNSISTLIRYYNGTIWTDISSGGSVTSVALADGSTTPIYSISGSPVTTSGTLTFTLSNQSANQVFAGPITGPAAQPTFRGLVSTDIPNNAANTSGTASNITATSNSTLTTLSALSLPTSQLSGQVTLAQLPSIATETVLGNITGSTATPTAVALGTVTESTSSVLTLTGWSNATIGSPTIEVKLASSSQSGYLSSTDWTTFNNKQSALTFSDSLVNTGGTVTLVNDSASPGNSKYYGTNGVGTLGYFSLPTGTVTSVALADGSTTPIYSVSGSPVTSSGTLTFSLSNQSANQVFAGPTTGSAAQPTFRALVSNDIPSLSSIYLALAGGTMSGSINMNSNSITSLATPVNPGDAVTKAYVDNFINATSWKTAVLVATTANITLSGEQTIDGVLTSSSRVLVKNQSSAANNGIYISGSGAWTRSTDMATWAEVPAAAVFVESGTVNADIGFVCTAQPGGTLGTTAINFVQFSSAGAYSADNVTLQLVSGVFSIKNGGVGATQLGSITDGITLDQSGAGSTLEVKTGGISNTQIATAAAIAYSKLAALSLNIIPTTDGTSGFLESTSANAVSLYSAGFKRGLSGSNVVSETYNDSITLTDATTTSVAAFTFAIANFAGEEIAYVIETGTTALDCRIGTIRVSCSNGVSPVVSISDMYSESADCGVTWSAAVSTGTVTVSYTTTTQSANRTMRADVKQFRR
jgi:hypothetical protein